MLSLEQRLISRPQLLQKLISRDCRYFLKPSFSPQRSFHRHSHSASVIPPQRQYQSRVESRAVRTVHCSSQSPFAVQAASFSDQAGPSKSGDVSAARLTKLADWLAGLGHDPLGIRLEIADVDASPAAGSTVHRIGAVAGPDGVKQGDVTVAVPHAAIMSVQVRQRTCDYNERLLNEYSERISDIVPEMARTHPLMLPDVSVEVCLWCDHVPCCASQQSLRPRPVTGPSQGVLLAKACASCFPSHSPRTLLALPSHSPRTLLALSSPVTLSRAFALDFSLDRLRKRPFYPGTSQFRRKRPYYPTLSRFLPFPCTLFLSIALSSFPPHSLPFHRTLFHFHSLLLSLSPVARDLSLDPLKASPSALSLGESPLHACFPIACVLLSASPLCLPILLFLALQPFPGDDISTPGLTLCLVPWADCLNHSSTATVLSCLTYDPDSRTARLGAHRAYPPGSEVFDSYGPWLSPRQLYLDHGFVDEVVFQGLIACNETTLSEAPPRQLYLDHGFVDEVVFEGLVANNESNRNESSLSEEKEEGEGKEGEEGEEEEEWEGGGMEEVEQGRASPPSSNPHLTPLLFTPSPLSPLPSPGPAPLLLFPTTDSSRFSLTPAGPDDSIVTWLRAALASPAELAAAGWRHVDASDWLSGGRSWRLEQRAAAVMGRIAGGGVTGEETEREVSFELMGFGLRS
ncbi:unnamed protein product [Closterium sp. NIES-54]